MVLFVSVQTPGGASTATPRWVPPWERAIFKFDVVDPSESVWRIVVAVTIVAIVGAEAICFAIYAAFEFPVGMLDSKVGLVAVVAPAITAGLLAPLISMSIARSGLLLWRALNENDRTRAELLREVAEREAAQAQLEYQVRHDPLTGVLNRRGFFEQATASIGSRALLLVDLDEFKIVNDHYGHGVGDQLLRVVAAALVRTAGPDAFIGRLGGDEFVVLMADDHFGAADEVRRALSRMEIEVAAGTTIVASASVGQARLATGSDIDGALVTADHAMYRTKRSTRQAG